MRPDQSRTWRLPKPAEQTPARFASFSVRQQARSSPSRRLQLAHSHAGPLVASPNSEDTVDARTSAAAAARKCLLPAAHNAATLGSNKPGLLRRQLLRPRISFQSTLLFLISVTALSPPATACVPCGFPGRRSFNGLQIPATTSSRAGPIPARPSYFGMKLF